MKLVSMKFFSSSCYYFFLTPNLPQRPFFEHPQPIVSRVEQMGSQVHLSATTTYRQYNNLDLERQNITTVLRGGST